MSTLTDRIHPWISNPPRNSPAGETAILVLDNPDQACSFTWIAIRIGTDLEPIALAQQRHPTRHDATVDAIEHVPDWNIIRSL